MNDPMFIEIAAYGKLLESSPGSIEDKITLAFRRLLTRPPSPEEPTLPDLPKTPPGPARPRSILTRRISHQAVEASMVTGH